MKFDLEIEEISNGYIVTMDKKKKIAVRNSSELGKQIILMIMERTDKKIVQEEKLKPLVKGMGK